MIRKLIVGLVLALSVNVAHAQEWPSARPIKFIVSQAAGSTPDIICRILADQLSPLLGQAIVIENRPGGGNVIGAQAAARSDADGYTFFFATAAALVTNPYTMKNLPYDPVADFVPVGMIAKGPFFILVNSQVNANSLKDIFALDKAEPGKLSIATEGARNFTGILASWLKRNAGASLTEVPYNTITQGIQDTIAGRVQLISLPIASAVPFLEKGELKAVAVSSAKPMPGFDNVEPIAATLPGVELIGWFVLVAPKGTPAVAVNKTNRDLEKILTDPKIKKRLGELGFFTDGAETPDATANFLKAQYETWGKVSRDIGLEPQ